MTPVNETLASYSELFMLIASFIYLIAFLLFSWDMATASRSIRKLEAELETEKSRELVGAGGPSVPEPVQPQQLVSDDMEYTDSIKRPAANRSEEHTSELQSRGHLVCRLLLEKKKSKLEWRY